MKKIVAVILISLTLANCAGVNSTLDTIKSTVQQIASPDTLDTIQLSYGAALSIAVAYRSTCEKKIINKNCWIIIEKLQPYEAKAYASVVALRNFSRNNPAGNASAYISLAREAISIFSSKQAELGIK